jgi:trimeric autotransporter adhesin
VKKTFLYFSLSLFSFSNGFAQNGIITTIAGENPGNNVTATDFAVNPYSVVPDNAGNVYIADASNHVIHKLNILSGMLTVYAGNGSYGYYGDGGPATDAQFNYPVAVALDKNNNLYVVDESDQCVRMINNSTGIITTYAGNGNWGYNGDNIPATNANLYNPLAIAFDSANNLYISDYSNNRIRVVNALTGLINTIAGYDSTGYNGDSIPADSARLNGPAGIALDKHANIYFVDQNNCRIRMINAITDTIYTISGGKAGYSGDGGPATKAQFWYPLGITLDASGNIYIGDTYDNRIREITISNDTIRTICGNGNGGFSGDGGQATAAVLWQPHYLAFDAAGNLFFADMANNRVREILASNGTINTLAGDGYPGFNGNNISALTTQLSNPTYITSDDTGNIFIADNGNNMIREVKASTGNILKVAGTGIAGFSGDGGPAGKAQMNGVNGLAVNDTGNIYFADEYNNRIREINMTTNTIKTIAGTGYGGYSGNGGYATAAEFRYPVDVTVDSKGDIFIADMVNDRVREIIEPLGQVKLIAGNGYNASNWGGGYSGDNGPATNAELYQPQGVALDNKGNLYIADTWNDRIRKVDLTTNIITTVAGNGTWGYNGDGGPATDAELGIPTSIKVDAYGDLFIADFYNNVIREVSVWDSTINTVAGTSFQGYGGDGGPAGQAYLDLGHGLTFDPSWNLYIADYGNNRIRKVNTPLSVKNIVAQSSIAVYPNPASDEIFIHVNGFNGDNATLDLIDMTGRTLIHKELNNIFSPVPLMLNVSALPAGAYIVNLKSANQHATTKIVKE